MATAEGRPLTFYGGNHMAQAKANKSKSQKIKEAIATVQVFARTGRLPIVSDTEEFVAPGYPLKKVPGIVLDFVDGVCELDPARDADTIKAFREWMADGTDPRIAELGVMEIAKDALVPPFPKWDSIKPEACIEAVDQLGLDVEHCLRYELQKDEPRTKLVKQLEAKVDEPAVEDADAEPVL